MLTTIAENKLKLSFFDNDLDKVADNICYGSKYLENENFKWFILHNDETLLNDNDKLYLLFDYLSLDNLVRFYLLSRNRYSGEILKLINEMIYQKKSRINETVILDWMNCGRITINDLIYQFSKNITNFCKLFSSVSETKNIKNILMSTSIYAQNVTACKAIIEYLDDVQKIINLEHNINNIINLVRNGSSVAINQCLDIDVLENLLIEYQLININNMTFILPPGDFNYRLNGDKLIILAMHEKIEAGLEYKKLKSA